MAETVPNSFLYQLIMGNYHFVKLVSFVQTELNSTGRTKLCPVTCFLCAFLFYMSSDLWCCSALAEVRCVQQKPVHGGGVGVRSLPSGLQNVPLEDCTGWATHSGQPPVPQDGHQWVRGLKMWLRFKKKTWKMHYLFIHLDYVQIFFCHVQYRNGFIV